MGDESVQNKTVQREKGKNEKYEEETQRRKEAEAETRMPRGCVLSSLSRHYSSQLSLS